MDNVIENGKSVEQSVYKEDDVNDFKCSSIYFPPLSTGEERTPVALFGQSFTAV